MKTREEIALMLLCKAVTNPADEYVSANEDELARWAFQQAEAFLAEAERRGWVRA